MKTSDSNIDMRKFDQMIYERGLMNKPFQRHGVEWCVLKELGYHGPMVGHKRVVHGGILADEMGLGKTMTIMGAMLVNPLKYTLIVLPVCIIAQWAAELQKNIGINALVFHGGSKLLITARSIIDSAKIYGQVVVITSYATLSRSSATPLFDINWNRVIYDEAHHLRNKNSKQHYASRRLHSHIRWMISGTPFQNSIRDLYAIFKIIGFNPKLVHRNISVMLNTFFMRRTKQDANDIVLPNIKLLSTMVRWGRNKEAAHQIHSGLSGGVKQAPRHTRSYTKSMATEIVREKKQSNALVRMIRARQSCVLPIADEAMSAKIRALTNVIIEEKKDNGMGKLVFCVFRREIELVYDTLISAGVLGVAIYDGRTPSSERQKIYNGEKPINVLIMQIQVGCEGLNLQDRFNEVYFASPHWNPSMEEQAIARCHRVGQTKEVIVHRLHMENLGRESRSMDNNIYDIQNRKKQVIVNILSISDNETEK
jgi:SNF2 family DNA or RNA helicase